MLAVRWDVGVTRKLLENDEITSEIARRYDAKIEHWLYRQYLAFLLRGSRLCEFDDLLRRRVRFVERPSNLDRGFLLHLLVDRCVRGAWHEKAHVAATAAARRFEHEERAVAALLRCAMLCRMARSLGKWPDFDRAHRVAKEAENIARRLRADSFLVNANNCQAVLYRRQGRHREALKLALRPENFQDEQTENPIFARVNAAWIAVRCQRLSVAEKLLAEARSMTKRFGSPYYLIFFHTVKSDLHRVRGDLVKAAASLERAKENCHPDSDPRVRFLCRLSEAQLAYERSDALRAMECATECAELARGHAAFDVEAQGLLIQSSVLLDGKLDAELQDKLYERILPRLGAIGDPELLLKVLANLYLYTWESDRDIELSDLHLKQLSKLRPRLGHDRFEELYQRHVSAPVFDRIQRRMFGA